jgi:hypothetical protein
MKAVGAVLLALGAVLVAGAPVPVGEEGQAPALNTLQPLDEQRLASADTTAAPGKPSREAEFSTTESGRLLAVLAGIINEMRNDACGPLGPITIDDQQSIEVNKRVDGDDSVTHEFTAVFSMNETIHERAADGTIRKTYVKRNGLTVDAAISEMVDEEHEGKGDGFMTVRPRAEALAPAVYPLAVPSLAFHTGRCGSHRLALLTPPPPSRFSGHLPVSRDPRAPVRAQAARQGGCSARGQGQIAREG